MRILLCLLIIFITLCPAAYGQSEKTADQPTYYEINAARLLDSLATLKPFKSTGSEREGKNVIYVTKDEFQASLIGLSEKAIDKAIEGFVIAVAFSFRGDKHFLIMILWKDNASAKKFMKVEQKLWRIKEKQYEKIIKKIDYSEIDLDDEAKAFVTRKTLKQKGHKEDVTTFIFVKKNGVFECTLSGTYEDKIVKRLIQQIWDMVDSERRKG